MKKDKIYVIINNEKERRRVIDILKKAEEHIWEYSNMLQTYCDQLKCYYSKKENEWYGSRTSTVGLRNSITIDQLEELLNNVEIVSIPRAAFKEVYDKVCQVWQIKINSMLTYTPYRFSDNIIVSIKDVNEAWDDVENAKHHQTLLKNWLTKYAPLPKKKVTKEVVKYANVYIDGTVGSAQYTEDAAIEASKLTKKTRITTVKLTGTYEVEE